MILTQNQVVNMKPENETQKRYPVNISSNLSGKSHDMNFQNIINDINQLAINDNLSLLMKVSLSK